MKKYEYKLYDRFWAFKDILTPTISSKVQFSSQINWGQWQMTIDLDVPFWYTGVIKTDIVKITMYSDKFKNWLLIYSGFISKVSRRYEKSKSIVSLTVLWIASLLTRWTLSTPTFNIDPGAIITNVIWTYNSNRTGVDFIAGTIDTVWSNLNISFSWTSCFEAINQVVQKTTKYWYCGPDLNVNFQSSNTTIRASLNWEIDYILSEDDLENIVNSVEVEWSWWVVTASDATSITKYDTNKKKVSKKEILDSTSAQIYANNLIDARKDPLPKITCVINDTYEAWIETIKPWMIINVLNTEVPFNNLQIQKVEYNTYSVKLDLSIYNSFSQEILW